MKEKEKKFDLTTSNERARVQCSCAVWMNGYGFTCTIELVKFSPDAHQLFAAFVSSIVFSPYKINILINFVAFYCCQSDAWIRWKFDLLQCENANWCVNVSLFALQTCAFQNLSPFEMYKISHANNIIKTQLKISDEHNKLVRAAKMVSISFQSEKFASVIANL